MNALGIVDVRDGEPLAARTLELYRELQYTREKFGPHFFDVSAALKQSYNRIIYTLLLHYKATILPIERQLKLEIAYPKNLSDSDFEATLTILVLGPPCTGKTTLVQYITGTSYSGMCISADARQTKTFIVSYGESSVSIPLATLIRSKEFALKTLFPANKIFLKSCLCSFNPTPALKQYSVIDMPGILLEKTKKGICLTDVVTHIVDRADLVLVVLDTYRYVFPKEMKNLLNKLAAYEHKIIFILNKADTHDVAQLAKAYREFVWDLPRTMACTSRPKIYVGSFWSAPCRIPELKELFDEHQKDLLSQIRSLPKTSALRRLKELETRATRESSEFYGKLREPKIGGTPKKEPPPTWIDVQAHAEMLSWSLSFRAMKPTDGLVYLHQLKDHLKCCPISTQTLDHYLSLVDIDNDGMVNEDEFYLLMFLIMTARKKSKIFRSLPDAMLPPKKHKRTCENHEEDKTATFIPPHVTMLPNSVNYL